MRGLKPVIINLSKGWNRLLSAVGVSRANVELHIPQFSVSGFNWLGASFITIEFKANLDREIAFSIPVMKPSVNPNFCLAVRWPVEGTLGIQRMKLWEGVGEDLDYPLYDGRLLPKDFVLEVWTVQPFNITSLSEVGLNLKTSVKQDRKSVKCGTCSATNVVEVAFSVAVRCELFGPLPFYQPLIVDQCL